MKFLFIVEPESGSFQYPDGYLHRFMFEAEQLGHVVELLPVEDFLARPFEQIPAADMVIYSFMPQNIEQKWQKLVQLEKAGWCLLRPTHLPRSDKISAHKILHKADISLPQTWVLDKGQPLPADLPLPVVLKNPYGSQGKGVYLAKTLQERTAILAELFTACAHVKAQEVIEPLGRDIRAFVVGNKLVAAMERIARAGEFRANVGQGGTTRPIQLTIEEEKLAVAATQALGYPYAGVDIARSAKGPVVFEVNKGPGVKGIEAATGVNVARLVIEHAVKIHADNCGNEACVKG